MTKPSVAYVNGNIVPIEDANVSVLDRGFLFADGIYEVVAVVNRRLVDFPSHLARLQRSAREINLDLSDLPRRFRSVMEDLIAREAIDEGMVYLQISRGQDTKRGFGFPDASQVPATVVMFVQALALVDNPLAKVGAKAITIPDIRWARRDIKSTALLPQVLGKQLGVEAGVFEAWMVEDGYVTEGTSSSACIITAEGVIVTRPITSEILDSITRRAVYELAAKLGLKVEERRFTVDEAYQAKEAFVASATALVMPIVEIDGRRIGDGMPGATTLQLREMYLGIASSEQPEIADFD